MRIVIHQPNFLPRLKVLQKLASADIWVVLDTTQFSAYEWQNRARIVPAHGNYGDFWLTLPVHRCNGRRTVIRDVKIVEPYRTPERMRRTLLHALRRSPYWDTVMNFLETIKPSLDTSSLTQLCVDTTTVLLKMAGVVPEILYSSSIPAQGAGSSLMANICRELGADSYIADSGAIKYLNLSDFTGIRVQWQHWREPTEHWPGINSWRNISALNYLAREGPIAYGNHLRSYSLETSVPNKGS